MASQYISYVTRKNDRWDLLAWRFYGDPMLFGMIIAANFGFGGVPASPVLNPGMKIRVPVIVVAAPALASSNLPPWKR
jgi:phage tail protein X